MGRSCSRRWCVVESNESTCSYYEVCLREFRAHSSAAFITRLVFTLLLHFARIPDMFPAVCQYICRLISDTPKFHQNVLWVVDGLRQKGMIVESEPPRVLQSIPSSISINAIPMSPSQSALTPVTPKVVLRNVLYFIIADSA